MSFGIIVKGGKGFSRHFNRELTDKAHPTGQWVHTREDYNKEMKKRGLEPYDPSKVKETKSKPYKTSKEAHEFIQSVKNREDKNGKVELSGGQKEWLSKRLSMKPVKNSNSKRGGFSD